MFVAAFSQLVMIQWKRFCAKLFSLREHDDTLRRTSKCGCQRSTIPEVIRVDEESPNQFRSRSSGSISIYELESLVGLEILEDARSVANGGNDSASTSSLDYSDTLVDVSSDDAMIEPVCTVCVRKSTAANEASFQLKCRERLDVSIETISTVEVTRITI